MTDAEANALINAADCDGNLRIDFSEFSRLWEAIHDESEVRPALATENISCKILLSQKYERHLRELIRIKVVSSPKVRIG